ncbi:hypothetical protein EDD18DRAFT_1355173 [Armillaria luteobubalina]|uniref:Uncharacterized protein n=1 Tax=Armillaria luteobubalina TaxID=153913 RepID=A0AA39Q1D5_9AGAR|nr:hypothetical protein EDD18DRAFT_1355173 [Armillaria luteobubalina]
MALCSSRISIYLDLQTNTTLSTGPTITFITSPTLRGSSWIRLELEPAKKSCTPRMVPNELRHTFGYRHHSVAPPIQYLVRCRTHTHPIHRPRTVAISLGCTDPPTLGLPKPKTTYISFLSCFLIYTSVQIIYDASTVVGIAIFCQLPSEWPSLYDSIGKILNVKTCAYRLLV